MTETALPTVGFVGLGRMGANMARRLKACGFSLGALYDIHPVESLTTELDTVSVKQVSDVTRLSDVIITVVSDDPAMQTIYTPPPADSLWTGSEGKLFINCATVSPSVHHGLAQQAERYGADTLEAPMISSIPQALAGTLLLLCAGKPETFARAQAVLRALSSQAIYTGAAGSAATLKALVNMVMNINTAALAEGLGLADALGLDLELVRQVFAISGANSRVLETDGEDMQNRAHDTWFSAAHAAKDSGIALALGVAEGLPMPLAHATLAQYEAMLEKGLGHLDKSGIAELTFKGRHTHSSN